MRYPGGKNHGSSYPRIINQIPPHTLYIEPFAGSAAIRRMMRPSERSILIDLDPGALGKLAGLVPPNTELLRTDALSWLEVDPERIALWPPVPTVIYCDPPYLASACKSRLRYEHVLTDDHHYRLLRRLEQLRCKVLISGYWSELYADMLHDWRVVSWPQITRGGTWAQEFLWCNFPEPVELHDYAHLGADFRERQDVRRQQERWRRKLAAMSTLKRQALLSVLDGLRSSPLGTNAVEDLRGIPAEVAGQLGRYAESGRARPPTAETPRKYSLQPRQIDRCGVTQRREGAKPLELVLSLFPGLDLFGTAFTAAGFSVLRGPDPLYNSRIEDFHIPAGKVTGIIAGPPCQDFSKARRCKPSGHGLRMLAELLRVIDESQPEWVVIENVPQVPDIVHPAYSHQRLDIADCECGGTQLRRRHVQFLSLRSHIIRPEREYRLPRHAAIMTVATAAQSHTYAEICRRMGFPGPVTLPGWRREAKVRAVGNGVPLSIGRSLAIAVSRRSPPDLHTDCVCLCGRPISPPASHAGPACRKRMERRRKWTAAKMAWSVTAGKAEYTPQMLIGDGGLSHVRSQGDGLEVGGYG